MSREEQALPAQGAAQGARGLRAPIDGAFARELVEVARSFNRGDFALARSLCGQVLQAPDATAQERAFASELTYRTGIDPMTFVAGVVVASLWVVLSLI